jgi:hypothetical protein
MKSSRKVTAKLTVAGRRWVGPIERFAQRR